MVVTESVKILYGKDTKLELGIIKLGDGKTKVRLINQESLPSDNFFTVFDITEEPTKLETPFGIICGKPNDPGVVACSNDGPKSQFKFVEKDGFVNLVVDNNKCLKKKGFDRSTKGYYTNLSQCDGSKEQLFIIQKIPSPESGQVSDNSEVFIPCEM